MGKENIIEQYQDIEDVYARIRELDQEKRGINSPEELEMLEREITLQRHLEFIRFVYKFMPPIPPHYFLHAFSFCGRDKPYGFSIESMQRDQSFPLRKSSSLEGLLLTKA